MKRHELRTLVESTKPTANRYLCSYDGADRDQCLSVALPTGEVIAKYWEDDYQGVCAWAFRFPDGSVLLVSDYFGSCSGCDSFQAVNSEYEAYELTRTLIYNGKLCHSVAAAIRWIKKDASEEKYSSERAFTQLLTQLAEATP